MCAALLQEKLDKLTDMIVCYAFQYTLILDLLHLKENAVNSMAIWALLK